MQDNNMKLILPHQMKNWESVEACIQPYSTNGTRKLDKNALLHILKEVRNDVFYSISDPEARGLFVFLGATQCPSNAILLIQFSDSLPQEDVQRWYTSTVPVLFDLILSMPSLFMDPVPLLFPNASELVRLTRLQCASILASGFFGMCYPLPPGLRMGGSEDGMDFNSFNFEPIKDGVAPFMQAKIACFVNYFTIVTEKYNTSWAQETVTIYRHSIPPLSTVQLESNFRSEVIPHVQGSISDCQMPALHSDFANKYIGGGVLGSGRVQEEILFTECPECLIAIAICSVMKNSESIVIRNAIRYSITTGYAGSLKFERSGDINMGDIVGFDATPYFSGKLAQQFQEHEIMREIRKATSAFSSDIELNKLMDIEVDIVPVASGNWGAGAFRGDHELKAIIQMIAASIVNRPIHYYKFGDVRLNIEEMMDFFSDVKRKGVTVGEVVGAVKTIQPEKGKIFSRVCSVLGLNTK